jgi:hypothetical protein
MMSLALPVVVSRSSSSIVSGTPVTTKVSATDCLFLQTTNWHNPLIVCVGLVSVSLLTQSVPVQADFSVLFVVCVVICTLKFA